MFAIGIEHGQHERAMKNATVHVNGQLPLMQGKEKDHKDAKNGIKMRPVMNTMDGPKKNISDNFSDILEEIIDDRNDGVLCSSTEELLEAFEAENKVKNEKKKIIASMDAVSFSPV